MVSDTHTETHSHEEGHFHGEAHSHPHTEGHTHSHTHAESQAHPHSHGDGPEHPHSHSHVHDPAVKKRQLNRLSRIIGHLEYVKRMIEADEDCSDVLMQIAATRSALNGLGKSIINEHLSHCISHAIEEGDLSAVEEFQTAIQKYV